MTTTVAATVDGAEATIGVEPGPYADVAAELHRIADDLATVRFADVAKPDRYVRLSFLPTNPSDPYEQSVARVNAVAVALLGKPATIRRLTADSDYGTHRCEADGRRGDVQISVHGTVTPPGEETKDAELARLRAENAELKRAAAGELTFVDRA